MSVTGRQQHIICMEVASKLRYFGALLDLLQHPPACAHAWSPEKNDLASLAHRKRATKV